VKETVHLVLLFCSINGEQKKWLGLVLVEVAIQFRHLGAAGFTPGGEEVQDNHLLADVFGKFEVVAVGGAQFEIGSEVPAPFRTVDHALGSRAEFTVGGSRLQLIVHHAEDAAREDDRHVEKRSIHWLRFHTAASLPFR
jgi:hypothetical protein